MRGRFAVAGLVAIVAVTACSTSADLSGHAPAPSRDHARATCGLYASPSGSDSASGQLGAPLGSIGALDRALAPGQTGCLLAGSYGGLNSSFQLRNSGTAGAPITITSAPGQSVQITGFVDLEGSYTTLSGLNIDGSNDLNPSPRPGTNCNAPSSYSLEINGHDDTLQDSNYYQSVPSLRANGIGVGWNGQANNTVIRDNRIHDVGSCLAYDHLIYLGRGSGAQIYDNWMWNDPHGWGVQIYPDASNAHIYDNVIDNAGSGFVIGGGSQVSGNTIDHNIVMNSTGLPNAGLAQGVAVSTCCGLGNNNSFYDNISYNNPGGIAARLGNADNAGTDNSSATTAGLDISRYGNTVAAPQLADPQHHDYRVTGASPTILRDWSLWDGSAPRTGTSDP